LAIPDGSYLKKPVSGKKKWSVLKELQTKLKGFRFFLWEGYVG